MPASRSPSVIRLASATWSSTTSIRTCTSCTGAGDMRLTIRVRVVLLAADYTWTGRGAADQTQGNTVRREQLMRRLLVTAVLALAPITACTSARHGGGVPSLAGGGGG